MILLFDSTINVYSQFCQAEFARITREQVDNRDLEWHENIKRRVRIVYALHDFPLPCAARKEASGLSDDDQWSGGDQVSDEEGDAPLLKVENAEVSDEEGDASL